MASRSRSRGQVSELVHLAPIRQEVIAGGDGRMRYADRLRLTLESFNVREDQGSPGVIRVFRGLHNATWALIDGDTRLLLNVIFDGDLHGYLRALAAEVPATLELVWGNCEGWEDPAHDPQKLIDFIERHQVRAGFFYCQFPQLTVPDTEQLLQLKAAYGHLDGAAGARALQARVYEQNAPLSRAERIQRMFSDYGERQRMGEAVWAFLGSLYRPELVERVYNETFVGRPAALPIAGDEARAREVQALVVSEQPEAHAARMLLLHLPNTETARAWLGSVRQRIAFGRQSSGPASLSIGFTHAGLQRLAVSAALLQQFPEAFVQGMQARAQRLGDAAAVSSASARAGWTEHAAELSGEALHVVLFVHAQVPQGSPLHAALLREGQLARAHAAEPSRAAQLGTPADRAGGADQLRELLRACLDDAQASLELSCTGADSLQGAQLLGYQDLHHPLVSHDAASAPYVVEYFGFRDGISQPRLPGEPYSGLMKAEPPWLQERASFDPVLRRDEHGLLKNASFLVVRQLRQDTAAFWTAMRERAEPLGIGARELAEQIMGRRMDGRRLDSAGEHFDPEQDRHAFDPTRAAPSCPFHSHVRRTNPRTEPDHAHNPRLLRRGLSYSQGRADGDVQGLMFLAFNADIESQFELIQKNWVQGGNQVGLSSHDRDVVAGLEPATGPHAPGGPARFYAQLPDRADKPAERARELQFERPFVVLEWGTYLFFPAREALLQL